MNLYLVVTERDGATVRAPGSTSTELQRHEYWYACDNIATVWDQIAWLRGDPECEVLAIITKQTGITVLP